MAEIFPDEGLDLILSYIPKGTAPPTTLYVGLFSSQTATTVPANTAVLATATGVTEVAGTGYARQSIAAAAWAAQSAATGGRKTVGPQVTFTAGGAWSAANGFFISDSLTGGKAFLYANFDDGVAVTLQNGDTLKLTPTWTVLQ